MPALVLVQPSSASLHPVQRYERLDRLEHCVPNDIYLRNIITVFLAEQYGDDIPFHLWLFTSI